MTSSLQIKKGYYHVVIYDKTAPKGKQYKWVSTHLPINNNKRKAEQIAKEVLAKYEDKRMLIDSNVLFADFINEWLEAAETKVRSNTFHNYKIMANAHIVPYFKNLNITLQNIQAIHIQKYFASKIKGIDSEKALSSNSVLKHKAIINGALNYALQQGLIKNNPMSQVICPRKVEYVPSPYNTTQLQMLFEKIKGTNIEPVIRLAATYGLRREEVLGLKWSAINFTDCKISISNVVVMVGSNTEERSIMKTKKSRRTLPLTNDMITYLKALKIQQNKNKLLLGQAYNDNDFICKWDNGRPFKPNYISQKFKELLAANNLPHTRFHDLRHTYATLLAYFSSIFCLIPLKISEESSDNCTKHTYYSLNSDVYCAKSIF